MPDSGWLQLGCRLEKCFLSALSSVQLQAVFLSLSQFASDCDARSSARLRAWHQQQASNGQPETENTKREFN